MNWTHLVQRLNKPRVFHPKLGIKDNPFSFGGGLLRGGLSAEAMDLLRPIMSFDYMGAAEFEFGAVPRALSVMAENHKEYEGFTIEINRKSIRKPFDLARTAKWAGKVQVHVFCKKADREEVERRIRAIAKSEAVSETGVINLKEGTRFCCAVDNTKDKPDDTRGWLELDNSFFWTIDQGMFDSFVSLFTPQTKPEDTNG